MIGSTHYVSTEEELLDWADALTNNTSLNCVLLDDITLTEDWTPVCIDGYAGTFDGRGHKISNLKIKAQGSNCGLFFGILENAVVKNLTVEVPSYTDTRSYGNVGAVVGNNNGTIENCHSIINTGVSASVNFGGIAATNKGIIKGYSSRIGGQISDPTNIGGIAGTNNGKIAASFMILEETGSLSSTDSVYCAGIAGNNTGAVTGCYSVINGKISNNQSESYAIALDGDCTACYWQSSDESFEDNTSHAKKVTAPEGWGEVMSTMNDVIGKMG